MNKVRYWQGEKYWKFLIALMWIGAYFLIGDIHIKGTTYFFMLIFKLLYLENVEDKIKGLLKQVNNSEHTCKYIHSDKINIKYPYQNGKQIYFF